MAQRGRWARKVAGATVRAECAIGQDWVYGGVEKFVGGATSGAVDAVIEGERSDFLL